MLKHVLYFEIMLMRSYFLCLIISSTCYAIEGNGSESLSKLATNNQIDYKVFLEKIFEKYGHNGVITRDGLENLLVSLGLDTLPLKYHNVNNHKTGGQGNKTSAEFHDITHKRVLSDETTHGSNNTHNHALHASTPDSSTNSLDGEVHEDSQINSGSKLQIGYMLDRQTENHSAMEQNNTLVNWHLEKCLSPSEIMWASKLDPINDNISPNNFVNICPVIIYELDRRRCRLTSTDHDHKDIDTSEDESVLKVTHRSVWFYSTLAVLIISITGMLSVAIVPIIQRFYYQQLLHYCVALAIGSLTGDALLHLLPHAMTAAINESGSHSDHKHTHSEGHSHGNHNGVWLGLTALGGICLFFAIERMLSLITLWRRERSNVKISKSEFKLNTNESLNQSNNSYGYGEIPVVVFQGLNEKHVDEGDMQTCTVKLSSEIKQKYGSQINNTSDTYDMPMVPLCQSTVMHHSNVNEQSTNLDMNFDSNCMNGDKVTSASHEISHHGHSHSHAHEVPQTVSAMAWMVIAGDGLHNFSDGMAIGAAFASSLTGGLSTAVAVFCHELPHELGDFALLLKAGMGTWQALLYNGLSSFLCFIGMLVGLAIGNISSASSWVFAGVAGMFLYIALVDMVPELNSDSGIEFCGLKKFVVQALGIATGITIMCLIALYEHELQFLFS